jgi:hypothetical protein
MIIKLIIKAIHWDLAWLDEKHEIFSSFSRFETFVGFTQFLRKLHARLVKIWKKFPLKIKYSEKSGNLWNWSSKFPINVAGLWLILSLNQMLLLDDLTTAIFDDFSYFSGILSCKILNRFVFDDCS